MKKLICSAVFVAALSAGFIGTQSSIVPLGEHEMLSSMGGTAMGCGNCLWLECDNYGCGLSGGGYKEKLNIGGQSAICDNVGGILKCMPTGKGPCSLAKWDCNNDCSDCNMSATELLDLECWDD